jgi:hypothetical protein
MIELKCPNCGLVFPVIPVSSTGWCKCGLDYILDMNHRQVRWMPDPKYPQSGQQQVVQEIV